MHLHVPLNLLKMINNISAYSLDQPGSSNRSSPVIVLTNADYKRPSSIISSRSGKTSIISLPINYRGGFMLSCHVFIGIVIIIAFLNIF